MLQNIRHHFILKKYKLLREPKQREQQLINFYHHGDVSWVARLTDKEIHNLEIYYGKAIRQNKGSVKKMQEAVMSTNEMNASEG